MLLPDTKLLVGTRDPLVAQIGVFRIADEMMISWIVIGKRILLIEGTEINLKCSWGRLPLPVLKTNTHTRILIIHTRPNHHTLTSHTQTIKRIHNHTHTCTINISTRTFARIPLTQTFIPSINMGRRGLLPIITTSANIIIDTITTFYITTTRLDPNCALGLHQVSAWKVLV